MKLSMGRRALAVSVLSLAFWPPPLNAQSSQDACTRPPIGSMVSEPPDVRSKDGVLEINLTAVNAKQSDGSTRYCFTDAEGRESPTLRVNPGDLVIIHLKNAMTDIDHAGAEAT